MKILLTIDLNDPQREIAAAKEAVKQSQAFGAELHVMTILPELNNFLMRQIYNEEVGEKAHQSAEAQLKKFCQQYIPQSLEAHLHVASGIVYKEILQKSEALKADYIVIAASRPELADYLIGPNASRVVRHATCTVIVVR